MSCGLGLCARVQADFDDVLKGDDYAGGARGGAWCVTRSNPGFCTGWAISQLCKTGFGTTLLLFVCV